MANELEELIKNYKTETDNKKKRLAYLNLVEESLTLVKKIVAGVYPLPQSVGRDDLVQVGALGVLKAIELYEFEDKGSFKTYVSKFIKGRILQYLRDKADIIKPPRDIKKDEPRTIISLDETVFSPDGSETILDRIPSEDDEENFENKKVIEFALNKLAKDEKDVIYKYYIEGAKKVDIAREMNISSMQVARIIKRTLIKMNKIIESEE